MKKRIKKGFTLVELLVVIAILAILSTVAVVGYSAFTEKAKQAAADAELNQIKTYIVAEDINNDDFAMTANGIVFVNAFEAVEDDAAVEGDQSKTAAVVAAEYLMGLHEDLDTFKGELAVTLSNDNKTVEALAYTLDGVTATLEF